MTTAMTRSTDFEAMFFVGAQSAILKMATSKTLMVESETYLRGTYVDTFTISNGEAMANYVLKRTSLQPSPGAHSAPTPDKLIQAMPAQDAKSSDSQSALDRLSGMQAQAPSSNAAFIVHVVTHESADDADRQREKLISSGMSNVFVDGPVSVNGIYKYRVRIGPFMSREAAQATQTRLRTLGYNGAFITSQQ